MKKILVFILVCCFSLLYIFDTKAQTIKEDFCVVGSNINLELEGYTLTSYHIDFNICGDYELIYQKNNSTLFLTRIIHVIPLEESIVKSNITLEKSDEFLNTVYKTIVVNDTTWYLFRYGLYYFLTDGVYITDKLYYDTSCEINDVFEKDSIIYIVACGYNTSTARDPVIIKFDTENKILKNYSLKLYGYDKITSSILEDDLIYFVVENQNKNVLYTFDIATNKFLSLDIDNVNYIYKQVNNTCLIINNSQDQKIIDNIIYIPANLKVIKIIDNLMFLTDGNNYNLCLEKGDQNLKLLYESDMDSPIKGAFKSNENIYFYDYLNNLYIYYLGSFKKLNIKIDGEILDNLYIPFIEKENEFYAFNIDNYFIRNIEGSFHLYKNDMCVLNLFLTSGYEKFGEYVNLFEYNDEGFNFSYLERKIVCLESSIKNDNIYIPGIKITFNADATLDGTTIESGTCVYTPGNHILRLDGVNAGSTLQFQIKDMSYDKQNKNVYTNSKENPIIKEKINKEIESSEIGFNNNIINKNYNKNLWYLLIPILTFVSSMLVVFKVVKQK